MGNIVRHWSAINKVSIKQYEITDEFPFSFEPKKDIQLTDLFQILRNHNEGTEFDGSENYINGNPHQFGRAICSSTTQYGFVAQLRNNLPKDIAYVLWLAPFRPCVHTFTQWYYGMTEFPEGFSEGTFRKALETHFNTIENVFEYAPDNQFLEFVKHATKVDKNYKNQVDPIQQQIQKLEEELISNQPGFEKMIQQQGGSDQRITQKTITDYCKKQVERSKELIK
jgi:dipeptidase